MLEFLLLLLSSLGSVSAQEGDQVLSNLHRWDAEILGEFTLSATVLQPRLGIEVDSERLLHNVSITRSAGTWGTMREVDNSVLPPEYVSIRSDGRSSNYHTSGNLIVWRPETSYTLFETGFRGRYIASRCFTVTPSGSVGIAKSRGQETGLLKVISLFDSDNQLAENQLYVPVLSSGRGFSFLVDRITDVSQGVDGLLDCRGVGKHVNGTPAIWELTIDPGAAYAVRRSACFRQDNGSEIAGMENEGLQWFDKAPLPQYARYYPSGFGETVDGELCYEVTFATLKPESDKQILAAARELLRGEYPVGTAVRDYRGRGSSFKQHVIGDAELNLSMDGRRTLNALRDKLVNDLLAGQSEVAPKPEAASPLMLPASIFVPETSPDGHGSWYFGF